VKRVDRSNYKTSRRSLDAVESKELIDSTTAAERVAMVWQLTREA